MTTENITKIYTAYPEAPISSHNDCGRTYTIRLYQEGIIDSKDIRIKLDYEKDFPLRLFSLFEIYYDEKLIASNYYLCYTTNKDNTQFTINDIFPNYEFRLDTTNKKLIFKIQRNIIPAEPNNIKIMYKINTTSEEKPMLKHETLIGICRKCQCCNEYDTEFYLEHEPHNAKMYFISGTNYNPDNYSNKPIKIVDCDLTFYSLNDEKMEKFDEIHKGMNRYGFKLKNNIKESLLCILHYDYQI